MYRFLTIAITSILLSAAAHAQAGDATFEGLGDLPGSDFRSDALDMSTDGEVVVGFGHAVEGTEAYRWEGGAMEGLGDLPGGDFHSVSNAVSADGAVVVGEGLSEEGAEAFRWEDGTMEGLGDLPGGEFLSSAYAASADGSVVIGTGTPEQGVYEAFRWEDGVMEGLGDLPGTLFYSSGTDVSADGAVVVGFGASDVGFEAFRWEDSTMVGLGDLEGGDFGSVAYGVSADGAVIVGSGRSSEGSEAFRWEDGTMEGLGDLPRGDFFSIAYDMTADAAVVVGAGTSDAGLEAFIWTEEEGMRNFKAVLENDYGLDLTGWTLSRAFSISDDGTVIVGFGSNPDRDGEAWRAVIPYKVADEATPEALADVLSAPSPNPVSGTSTFTIAVKKGQHVAVEVFDVMGRHVQTVYEGTLAAGMSETLTLDAVTLPAGVYMIHASGEDFTRTQRVTIVN